MSSNNFNGANAMILKPDTWHWADVNCNGQATWMLALRNFVQSSDVAVAPKAMNHLIRFALADPDFRTSCSQAFIDEIMFIWKFLEQGTDDSLKGSIKVPDLD